MLPAADGLLNGSVEIIEQPSSTFFLDLGQKRCHGFVDGREAVKQAIYLILSVERYKYAILPWSYGVELEDLFGMPVSWAAPEAKRRIQEALLQDTRIKAVDNFSFQIDGKKLIVTFTAHTAYGDIDDSRGVDF